MHTEEVQRLRESWGAKPCSHPTFDKEFVQGKETGNRVCTTCGRSFNRADANALVADRINRPGDPDGR